MDLSFVIYSALNTLHESPEVTLEIWTSRGVLHEDIVEPAQCGNLRWITGKDRLIDVKIVIKRAAETTHMSVMDSNTRPGGRSDRRTMP